MWRKVLLSISLGLNIILFYALIWSEHGVLAFREMKTQFNSIILRMEDLGQKNILMEKEIILLKNDQKYLEKRIRNRLNFVRNNEILYIFPSGKDSESAGAQENEAKN